MNGSNGNFIGNTNCDSHMNCEDIEQEYQPTDADLSCLNEKRYDLLVDWDIQPDGKIEYYPFDSIDEGDMMDYIDQ